MKLPVMLRSTHEEELDRAINIITEKNRVIAVNKDELAAANKIKSILEERNEILNERLLLSKSREFRLEAKLKKLEEYIEKLEQVSENKTLRNCSLNTKLVAKDAKCKELDQANRKLIEMFNDANRKNWCNEESSRQLKKLSEEILECDKINKTNLASYIYNISQYMGGGIPIDIKVNENIEM